MILTTLTQAQVGGAASTVLSESNGKGVYTLLGTFTVTPGGGAAGALAAQYSWVDQRGRPHGLGGVLIAGVAASLTVSEVLNIQAGTDLTVAVLDAGGLAGSFSVAVETYAGRAVSQGND